MAEGRFRSLPRDFYARDGESVARDLLGRYLIRSESGRRRAIARIVETEAYLGAPDPASHAAGGRRTARTETMYRAGGVAYVYLIYGMHHCLNLVAGEEGEAQAVLIRAVEPVEGIDWMAANRGISTAPSPGQIGGGPGKLCQALAVDRTFDARSVLRGPLRCVEGEPVSSGEIAVGPRIGVDYAGEAATWPLRFAIGGHPHMSKPILR